jgi:chemotaxis protein MotB
MEQARLKKLRGDLDQLIEADPKLRALRPHLKIDLVQEGCVFRSLIARTVRCLKPAPKLSRTCAIFCAPLHRC